MDVKKEVGRDERIYGAAQVSDTAEDRHTKKEVGRDERI